MMFVIIRDHESDAINKEIDRFLAECPEKSHLRQDMFDALWDTYQERGVIGTLTQGYAETEMIKAETQ